MNARKTFLKPLRLFEDLPTGVRDLVVQSNSITTASYSWSLLESRLFCIILNQVNLGSLELKKEAQTINTDKDLTLRFHSDLLLDASNNKTKSYAACKRLRQRSMVVDDHLSRLEIGPINYSEYDKKSGMIEVQISRKILPYIVQLSREFTKYNLSTFLSLKSTYAQRFYELCKKWDNIGYFSYTIDEIRKMLKIDKTKYTTYGGFTNKIIIKGMDELLLHHLHGESELFFTFEPDMPSKKGKAITRLNFSIQRAGAMRSLQHGSLDFIAYLYELRCNLYRIFPMKGQRTIIQNIIEYAEVHPGDIPVLAGFVQKCAIGEINDEARKALINDLQLRYPIWLYDYKQLDLFNA